MPFGFSPVSIAVDVDTLVIMPSRNFFGSRRCGLLTLRGGLLMERHATTLTTARHQVIVR
jgi:hypothetical protein